MDYILTFALVTCATTTVVSSMTCLSCEEVPLSRDCQYIAKCGPHEVCYSSAYVTTAGAIRHDLGCRDINQCSKIVGNRSANKYLTCSECCNGPLCNSGLCGQTGIPEPSPSVRGPICYSCDQQLYPDTCHVIKECSRDEVCMLSRFKSQVGHDILYETKCAKPTECAHKQALFGKRRSITQSDTANCDLKCCSNDLCNSDCSGGQVVVSFTQSTTRVPTTALKTTTTTTTTTTPKPAQTVSASCQDAAGYNCYQYVPKYCNNIWGLQHCRRTCNLCHVPLNTRCIDQTICNAQALVSCNTNWGLQNCIRSCNRC